jgi:hypothetical protein
MDRKNVNIRILSSAMSGWHVMAQSTRRWLPSRGSVIFTVLAIASLIWATNAGAVPLNAPTAAGTSTSTIAYQGRLADSSGTPLTGTYNMIFRLYVTAAGGAPLWEEQWTGSNSVKVSDGLFNVMLGSLTPIPRSVVTGNDSLWLGITVDTDDEMMPRVQLGSVPFAVQALTVPDGSITMAKIASGAVDGDKVLPGSLRLSHTNFLAGTISIRGAAQACEDRGGEVHCFREMTVTHNCGETNYLLVTGIEHGSWAHRHTVTIHSKTANTFVVRATNIANNFWDETDEIIVHWLLLPLGQ